jgi:hypothetical protein
MIPKEVMAVNRVAAIVIIGIWVGMTILAFFIVSKNLIA